MKVKLQQPAKIWHDTGEIVEVSPESANFLISVGAAVPIGAASTKEIPEKPKRETRKK